MPLKPLIPFILLFGSLGLTAGAMLAPADGPVVAAVFPPWWSDAHIASAASSSGAIVGTGGVSFVVLMLVTPANGAAPIRRAGALLVLDPRRIGCADAGLNRS